MSTNTTYDFENPFRPIYEYYATFAWAAAFAVALVGIAVSGFPRDVFLLFAAFCGLMAGTRGVKTVALYRKQKNLAGIPLAFITRKQLRKKLEARTKSGAPPAIFLGYGYNWGQEHAQLVHTVLRQDPNKLVQGLGDQMGQPWIHGLGMDREEEIWIPIDHTAGHTLLVGTTRAGKTRCLDLFIAQALYRGEACLIWDPKGDRDLMECAKNACFDAGKESDFVYFHPAFPQFSARINPLANFFRATELATRIAALIPSETGADPFTAHSQMVLTNLCEGMLMINNKPTLTTLRRYIESGPETLVVKAAEVYFDKHVPEWRAQAQGYTSKGGRSDRDLAIGYIGFYRDVVQKRNPSTALEGLFHDFEHDKSHQQKMTASLTPVLSMLTAGALGELLSPDDANVDDDRIITDFARIIRNGQCCYLGLDSLSDNMVGSALGSMFVSDMTAVAGARYNYEDLDKIKPVNLIIDEAAELVSDKMIQLLNKAGGAKIRLIVATQTFADFAARVGSVEKARQVLGNLNNVIALRIIDGDTQKYVTESMPETYVRHIEYSQATDTRTTAMFDFGYKHTESMKETQVPIVPLQMFGALPNLEYFAKVSGGRAVKARCPILQG